uniref:Transposase n=1 Tax=Heterorhabditis bacteriophora TaxID=37862 RepID=A0A1I7XAM6_HETBA
MRRKENRNGRAPSHEAYVERASWPMWQRRVSVDLTIQPADWEYLDNEIDIYYTLYNIKTGESLFKN